MNPLGPDATGSPDITTLFFDVGGVLLVDFIERKVVDLAARHQKSAERMLDAKGRLRPSADLGRMSDPEFWAGVLGDVGVQATEEDWNLDPYLEEIGGVRPIVEELRRGGYRVAILSNDSVEMAAARRRRFGFDELFHDVIISAEHGLMKPDPRFYELAVGRMRTSARLSLFVDDRPENVEGARRIGMHAILFRDAGRLREEIRALGVRLPNLD